MGENFQALDSSERGSLTQDLGHYLEFWFKLVLQTNFSPHIASDQRETNPKHLKLSTVACLFKNEINME